MSFWPPVPIVRSEGSYADAILTAGPVGYWRLGEAAGPTAVDASGGGHSGTYQGGVTLAQPGALADGTTAALFDGGNTSKALIPAAATSPIENTSAVSVEVWFRPDAMPNALNIPLTIGQIGGSGTYIDVRPSGLLDAKLLIGGAQRSASLGSGATLGALHYVVISYDGTNFILWLNGVARVTNPFTGTLSGFTTGLTVGNYDGAGFAFNGLVDEVALYNRALSAAEIAAHYALRTSPVVQGGRVKVTTSAAHQLSSRSKCYISGHAGATPQALNGFHEPGNVTPVDATAFTLPFTTQAAPGSGGTVQLVPTGADLVVSDAPVTVCTVSDAPVTVCTVSDAPVTVCTVSDTLVTT